MAKELSATQSLQKDALQSKKRRADGQAKDRIYCGVFLQAQQGQAKALFLYYKVKGIETEWLAPTGERVGGTRSLREAVFRLHVGGKSASGAQALSGR